MVHNIFEYLLLVVVKCKTVGFMGSNVEYMALCLIVGGGWCSLQQCGGYLSNENQSICGLK